MGNTAVSIRAPQSLEVSDGVPAVGPAAAPSFVITAAAGTSGAGAGEQFTDLDRLAKLLAARFEGLGRGVSDPSQMALASARPEDWANAYGNIARSSIASLGFTRPHDFVMAHQNDWCTIERACNEARLPGRSLTAAPGTPGWCAPCEPRYDFAPPAVIDGIVDLPTVIAPRGCMTFPVMPDFGQLYAGAGFCYPAADYDLPVPPVDPPPPPGAKNKPCMMVPCPEQQTCTLDPCGICLQSNVLVSRAYPELIRYFTDQALVAWGHKMNCRDLSMMIEASTPVPEFGTPPLVLDTQTGPGLAASILEVVEYYATWMRYRFRLGRNASIEVVLPDWAKGAVRADLSKRMGVDLLRVTDALIDRWLLVRKVRVQWVLGLDEAFCDLQGTPPVQVDPATSLKFGGNALALGTGPAPGTAPAMWPETVSFLMYPAGTFFRARANLVNIEAGLADSALLKRNERQLLFLEEASTVCKRAYESLYITVNLCASGQTGGGSERHPQCTRPGPTIVMTPLAADATGMTFEITVDNHGGGPVTLNFGQTPPLPDASNDGDGVDKTIVTYTADGTWIVTATSDADATEVSTTHVVVPATPGVEEPDPIVTVVGPSVCDQSGMTVQVTVDNGGREAVVRAGQTPTLPAQNNPGDGTAVTEFVYTAAGTWTVTARDLITPATGTAQVTVPLLPVPAQPDPDASWFYDSTDATGNTVLVLADNHGCGEVTIDWGQTPALPTSTNPGDGTTETSQQYTAPGVWTVTVTDSTNPAATSTMEVVVPKPAVPQLLVTEEDGDPTRRTTRVTVVDPLAGVSYEVSWDGGATWAPMPTSGTPPHSVIHQEPTEALLPVAVRYTQVSSVVTPDAGYTLPWAGPEFNAGVTGPLAISVEVVNPGADAFQMRLTPMPGGTAGAWVSMDSNPFPTTVGAAGTYQIEVQNATTSGDIATQQITVTA